MMDTYYRVHFSTDDNPEGFWECETLQEARETYWEMKADSRFRNLSIEWVTE